MDLPNNMTNTTKFLLIGLVVVVALGGFMYLNGNMSTSSSSISSGVPSAGPGGIPVTAGAITGTANGIDPATVAQFSTLLSSISTITIDTSVFANPAYKALRDYPIVLGNDVIGRNNPFAPVGTDVATTSGTITAPSGASAATGDFDVQTSPVTAVTSTSAKFAAAIVMAVPMDISVVFQYGTTEEFGSLTPPLTISATGAATGTIKGLLPNTKYFVKASGVHNNGEPIFGETVSFTTLKSSAKAPTTTKKP